MASKSGKIAECDFGPQSKILRSNETCETYLKTDVKNCNNVLYQDGNNWHFCRNPNRGNNCREKAGILKKKRGICSNTKPEPVSRKRTRITTATRKLDSIQKNSIKQSDKISSALGRDITGISTSDAEKEAHIMEVKNAIELNENVKTKLESFMKEREEKIASANIAMKEKLNKDLEEKKEQYNKINIMLNALELKLKKLESTSKVSSRTKGGKKKTKEIKEIKN